MAIPSTSMKTWDSTRCNLTTYSANAENNGSFQFDHKVWATPGQWLGAPQKCFYPLSTFLEGHVVYTPLLIQEQWLQYNELPTPNGNANLLWQFVLHQNIKSKFTNQRDTMMIIRTQNRGHTELVLRVYLEGGTWCTKWDVHTATANTDLYWSA